MLFIFFIAFFITVPISWLVMNEWLNGFAFHANIKWWLYLLVGLAIVSIALITVIWQSWQVAGQIPA